MLAELLKPALEILSSYLKIRAVDAHYDLTRKIERDIEEMESIRDQLRGYGDPGSQLRADILQQRILRAQGIASTLPAPRFEDQSGPDDRNT